MRDEPRKQLAGLPFVIAGLSFIPLIGIVFGMIAIIWGILTDKAGGRKIALIGSSGIAFTVVLYGGLYYFAFAKRGGVYDELRTDAAKMYLNSAVDVIEVYKLQHGNYPESLQILEKSLSRPSEIFLTDPTDVKFGRSPRYFFYQRVGTDHYYLRGVGRDGVPFASDDLLPETKIESTSRIGLLTERRPELER